MTYDEWLEAETRKECVRETIAKKLKRGDPPSWIHDEDGFSMEVIREVQACLKRGKSEMYESIMEGLMEDLHDILTYGEPQGRKTVIDWGDEKEK